MLVNMLHALHRWAHFILLPGKHLLVQNFSDADIGGWKGAPLDWGCPGANTAESGLSPSCHLRWFYWGHGRRLCAPDTTLFTVSSSSSDSVSIRDVCKTITSRMSHHQELPSSVSAQCASKYRDHTFQDLSGYHCVPLTSDSLISECYNLLKSRKQ